MASTVDYDDNNCTVSQLIGMLSSNFENIFTNIQVTERIKKNSQLRERRKRLNIPPGQLLELFKHPLLANSCVLLTGRIWFKLRATTTCSCWYSPPVMGLSPSEFSWRGFFLGLPRGSFQ
jgi:hypothetical protein